MTIELCFATRAERRKTLPGDELVPSPLGSVTHAVTINAPPELVWPWLVQLGSGRAGWYSYDHVDNGGVPSARKVVAELQHVAVGDVMPWLPGAQDGFVVGEVTPERALVLVVPLQRSVLDSVASAPRLRASWALVLEPVNSDRTRLIARSRPSRDWLAIQDYNTPGRPLPIERAYDFMAKLPRPLLLPLAACGHYVMESRMLRGVKSRAERS